MTVIGRKKRFWKKEIINKNATFCPLSIHILYRNTLYNIVPLVKRYNRFTNYCTHKQPQNYNL